jgi:hypothetical protein
MRPACCDEARLECAHRALEKERTTTNDDGYFVAYDGTVWHSCYLDFGNGNSPIVWYSSSGATLPASIATPVTIGADGRVLAWAEDGTFTVCDPVTGKVFGRHAASELLPGSTGNWMLTARAHAGGYWLAGGTLNYEPSEFLTWAALDTSGSLLQRGRFAPFPAGVTVETNNWTSKYPVMDGTGALYQFAMLGTEGVIVRRPMHGTDSTIVFRVSQWDVSHPHQVLPEYLVTGP